MSQNIKKEVVINPINIEKETRFAANSVSRFSREEKVKVLYPTGAAADKIIIDLLSPQIPNRRTKKTPRKKPSTILMQIAQKIGSIFLNFGSK